jgi:transcriptional regulator with XRE-family HTH domain
MNIGKRLVAMRASRQLSQGDIERRTGLLRCYVSRVENGHTIPSLETLQRWANALEVEVYQLFVEGEETAGVNYAGVMEDLDGIDRRLLSVLRRVNKADRRLVLSMANKMAKKKVERN